MSRQQGITREAEEKKLRDTIKIADSRLARARESAQNLADELHEMLEIFDENDKEAQTLWNNTNSMFRQAGQAIRRAEQARRKPYFGRIDFRDQKLGAEEVYYIGRSAIAENPSEPDVIDWRAPISSVYYDSGLGETTYSVKGEGEYRIHLSRKRTYEIEDDRLKNYYDSDVVANDELLTKYLAKNKNAVLGNIIATIQQEQNEVIRKKPQYNLLIQGAAGSGKTTVAMHRISYILYNYELEYPPEDFYIIGSNQMLLNYITGVLPELDVYGVAQMTMEQLFVRLLYEDWDKSYTIRPVKKGITPPVKGTERWFRSLEEFCDRYEKSVIPMEEVRIEKTGAVLLTEEAIAGIMEKNRELSRADKITRLTEYLQAKLENEIFGKHYSYSADEKAALNRRAERHFGRRKWKGSVFELYDGFLAEQQEKGNPVERPGTAFDVYDLAALAYLYKRIKEDEVIREAGHVIIDEAQDFGMMAYCSLKYCLSKCSYTIMGDVSQNISLDYGLNDWTGLRKLMLSGECDYFGLLRKSYRNTVEISHFATEILYHGSFPIYPVEPIIRHGEEVRTLGCRDTEELLEQAASEIRGWLEKGRETVAVICADEEEAKSVHEGLDGKIPLLPLDREHMEFKNGVMVLSLENTKGLEFDAVLIFDASQEKFPAEDGYVKRLYVAATRALHELTVFYQGQLTALIADPVSEERRRSAVVKLPAAPKKARMGEREKTKIELAREQALEGDHIMAQRERYGPRRIAVQTFGSAGSGDAPATAGAAVRQKLIRQTLSAKEFGSIPDRESLTPAGHSRIDCAVKFVMKGKGYFDLCSSYGTLRIAPLSDDVIRICFAKGQCSEFPEKLPEYAAPGFRYKKRENPSLVEFITEKVIVHVDKKTGVLSFLTPQGKLLLTERAKDPRQVGDGQVWMYFDWPKGEKLRARGISDKYPERTDPAFARYISFGRESKRSPGVTSPNGYEILFPPGVKLLCCRIPSYGPYLSVEGSEVIDYYFKVQ